MRVLLPHATSTHLSFGSGKHRKKRVGFNLQIARPSSSGLDPEVVHSPVCCFLYLVETNELVFIVVCWPVITSPVPYSVSE